MAPPSTPFESDGETFISLQQEADFLQVLADETAATLTVAGTSTAGRNIYRLDLGDGVEQTMFITSLIHGNEQATREALLLWLRDLAYSTDPAIVNYLANHRIVALVPCNPDGFVANVRHVPDEGDPNRDFYRLSIKEARVVLGQFADVRPHVSLDIHEWLSPGSSPQYWGFPNGNPIVPVGIQQASQDWFVQTRDAIIDGGYPAAGYYLWNGVMRGGMSTICGVMHSVGLLNETNGYRALDERVEIQLIGLDTARRWHEDNAALCTQVVERSRELARGHTGPLPLYTQEFFEADPHPQLVDVAGYQLAPGETFPAHHLVAHDIRVSAGGFVPIQQEAAWVLPTLCDPDSVDKVVEAVRVPADPMTGEIVGMQVQTAEGGRRPVVGMQVQTMEGVRRPVVGMQAVGNPLGGLPSPGL